jgi:hypothetical protein
VGDELQKKRQNKRVNKRLKNHPNFVKLNMDGQKTKLTSAQPEQNCRLLSHPMAYDSVHPIAGKSGGSHPTW